MQDNFKNFIQTENSGVENNVNNNNPNLNGGGYIPYGQNPPPPQGVPYYQTQFAVPPIYTPPQPAPNYTQPMPVQNFSASNSVPNNAAQTGEPNYAPPPPYVPPQPQAGAYYPPTGAPITPQPSVATSYYAPSPNGIQGYTQPNGQSAPYYPPPQGVPNYAQPMPVQNFSEPNSVQNNIPQTGTPNYVPQPQTVTGYVPAPAPIYVAQPEPKRKVVYLPPGFTPEKYEERKKIRKIALASGISFLCFFAVSILWGEVLGTLCAFLGLDIEDLSFLSNPAASQLLQVILSSFAFTVPYIIIFRKAGFKISELMSFKRTEKGLGLPMFFFGVASCAFANIATSYLISLISALGVDTNSIGAESPEGIFGFLLSVLATAVTPALVEEFAFRGVVLGALRKYGEGFALMVTALTFGIMHGNIYQIPFAALIGLFLAFSVIKTGSMRVAIAIHFYNNFLSVFFEYFPLKLTDLQINAIYVVILIISLIAGIIALRAKKFQGNFFKLESNNAHSTVKEKFKWFFTSPVVIVFLSLSLLECIAIFLI